MKITKIVLFCLLFIAAAALISAEDTETADSAEPAKVQKNMTFMQCVSEKAAAKNTCYQSTKTETKTCAEGAKAQTEKGVKKSAAKECLKTYKSSKQNCKAAFQAGIKECRQIKHNFLDSIRAKLK